MILLNLGAGDQIQPYPWLSVDAGGSETEHPYVKHDITQEWPPGFPKVVEGAFLGHLAEHFDLQELTVLLWRVRELLVDGGYLRLSVPDAHHFFTNRRRDTPEFCRKTYDPGYGAAVGYTEYALFFPEHKQIFNKELLWLILTVAGFRPDRIYQTAYRKTQFDAETARLLVAADNRPEFSLFMEAQNDSSFPTAGQRDFAAYREECLKRR